MITRETLYKRTSTGKTQTWFVEIEGNGYRTTAGYIDGKKTTTNWTYAEGKNIGKANETTPEEQAALEVESMYTDRLKKKYHLTLDTIDEVRFFSPMLAEKWKDRKAKLLASVAAIFVYIQPKLDGIRCVINSTGMWSRNGKPILSSPHIFESLKHHFVRTPDITFDGELYNHEYSDDFNKLTSLINKKKPTAEDLAESREQVQYWVYDMFDKSSPEDIFSKRFGNLQVILQDVIVYNTIKIVATKRISLADVDQISMNFIADGFEGAMVRLDLPYELKRSLSLMKWKETEDAEFEIEDITEGEGDRAGIASRVHLKTKSGQKFRAMPNGKFAYCKWLLENKDKFIGKMGTVVYQNLTPDGIPRFGKFKVVRDYE